MPFLNQALHYYHATLLPALSFLHVMFSSVKQLPALSPRASSFRRLLEATRERFPDCHLLTDSNSLSLTVVHALIYPSKNTAVLFKREILKKITFTSFFLIVDSIFQNSYKEEAQYKNIFQNSLTGW